MQCAWCGCLGLGCPHMAWQLQEALGGFLHGGIGNNTMYNGGVSDVTPRGQTGIYMLSGGGFLFTGL